MTSQLSAAVQGSLMAVEVPAYLAPVFTVDFAKPEIRYTSPCEVTLGEGTEYNTTCGKSWKLDKYDADAGVFSFFEIEFEVTKEEGRNYVLEMLACQRKDYPFLSKVSITVNDRLVAREFQCYCGPDSHYFPDSNGKPSHLRWEVFEIGNELQDGSNTIRVSLEEETQSGVSISRLHIRPI